MNFYYDKKWVINISESDRISLWKSAGSTDEIVIKREDNNRYYKYKLNRANIWSYEKPIYDIKDLEVIEKSKKIDDIIILTPSRKELNYKNGYLYSIKSIGGKEILSTTFRSEEKVVFIDRYNKEITLSPIKIIV